MLTEEFRLDYCHLWQSLIWTDMKKIKKYSQRLGAGDLYPLLACMLTARSWNSVNRGISHVPVTASEVGAASWPSPLPNTRDGARARDSLWFPSTPGPEALDWWVMGVEWWVEVEGGERSDVLPLPCEPGVEPGHVNRMIQTSAAVAPTCSHRA